MTVPSAADAGTLETRDINGGAIVIDHVAADRDPQAGHDQRFEDFGGRMARVFRGLGIDARVGSVPGGYCPGAFRVNARETAKLVGTPQRITKDAMPPGMPGISNISRLGYLGRRRSSRRTLSANSRPSGSWVARAARARATARTLSGRR